MKILKYILLVLIIWGVPSFSLAYINPSYGALFSLLLNVFLFAYFLLNKKSKPLIIFLILGLSYYTISGIFYTGEMNIFLTEAIKYFIFIIGGLELAKRTKIEELQIIFFIGAISILVHTLVFPNPYGRYSGFYINPNNAGFVCLIGYAISYSISNIKFRLISQFLFAIAGLMTFSRYFILLLILTTLISIIVNKKNIISLVIGTIGILVILGSTSIKLNSDRLSAFKSVFSDDVDSETITKESRNETWALYYDVILSSPFAGNGYKSMQGRETDSVGIQVGVHNTFLMILGEAGILPFTILFIIYITIFINGFNYFSINTEYHYLSIILLTSLLVSHNYFDNYLFLFISIWIYFKVKNNPETNPIIET